MITVDRIVRVFDTDCTKALYFTSSQRFVQEAFEELLRIKKGDLKKRFFDGEIALPVVYSESNHFHPIFLGDHLKISLKLEFGNTSFTVKGEIFHEGKLKGNVLIKHVCINPKILKKLSCKELFHDLLES
jgi:acyl-CoA thioesterase FadM